MNTMGALLSLRGSRKRHREKSYGLFAGLFCLVFLPFMAAAQNRDFFRVELQEGDLPLSVRRQAAPLKAAIQNYLNGETAMGSEALPRVPYPMAKLRFVLRSVEGDVFVADFSMTLQRPIYQSVEQTPLLQIFEKGMRFRFVPGNTLQEQRNSPTHNLEAILSAYRHLAMGLWYESFEAGTGDAEWKAASAVATMASGQAQWQGWETSGVGMSRYERCSALSQADDAGKDLWFRYHRELLDKRYRNADLPEQILPELVSALEAMQRGANNVAQRMWLYIWRESKATELMQLAQFSSPLQARIKKLFPTKYIDL